MAYYTGSSGSSVMSNSGRQPSNQYGVVGVRGGINLRDGGYPDSTSGAYYSSPIVQPEKTPTGGGTKDGSGSGSGNSAYLSALMAKYQGVNASDYLAQLRAAAQNAYDRGMSTLYGARDSMLGALGDNRDAALSSLNKQGARQRTQINDSANSSLRNAYIANRVSQKNLPQRLANVGLRGGATETAMVNLDNNYGASRNHIEDVRANNLEDLAVKMMAEESAINQQYNQAAANVAWQVAQQQMALENALANNEVSAQKDYYNLLMDQNEQAIGLLKSMGLSDIDLAKLNPNMFNSTWLNGVSALPEQRQTEVSNAALLKALEDLGITA